MKPISKGIGILRRSWLRLLRILGGAPPSIQAPVPPPPVMPPQGLGQPDLSIRWRLAHPVAVASAQSVAYAVGDPCDSAPPPWSPPLPLVRLRRAAAIEAFQLIGLLPPPEMLWTFVDKQDDVGAAINVFFEALGCPLERLSTVRANLILSAILRAEAVSCRPDLTVLPQANLLSRRRRLLRDNIRRRLRHPAAINVDRRPDDEMPFALINIRRLAAVSPEDCGPVLASLLQLLDATLSDLQLLRQRILESWRTDWHHEPQAGLLNAVLCQIEAVEHRLETAPLMDYRSFHADVAELSRAEASLSKLADVAETDRRGEAVVWPVDVATETDAVKRQAWLELLAPRVDGECPTDLGARWREVRWRFNPESPHLGVAERFARYRVIAELDRTLSCSAV